MTPGPRKGGLKLSGGVRSLPQVPRRSAGRRARPVWRARAPSQVRVVTRALAWRGHGTVASISAPPPQRFEGRDYEQRERNREERIERSEERKFPNFQYTPFTDSDATRREGAILFPPPLEGESRGPKGRGVGCAAMQG